MLPSQCHLLSPAFRTPDAVLTPAAWLDVHFLRPTTPPHRAPQALWPLRGNFALLTSTFAAIARGFAGSQRPDNARPDNEQMLPLELCGYEPSPFVRPVREKVRCEQYVHRLRVESTCRTVQAAVPTASPETLPGSKRPHRLLLCQRSSGH